MCLGSDDITDTQFDVNIVSDDEEDEQIICNGATHVPHENLNDSITQLTRVANVNQTFKEKTKVFRFL